MSQNFISTISPFWLSESQQAQNLNSSIRSAEIFTVAVERCWVDRRSISQLFYHLPDIYASVIGWIRDLRWEIDDSRVGKGFDFDTGLGMEWTGIFFWCYSVQYDTMIFLYSWCAYNIVIVNGIPNDSAALWSFVAHTAYRSNILYPVVFNWSKSLCSQTTWHGKWCYHCGID